MALQGVEETIELSAVAAGETPQRKSIESPEQGGSLRRPASPHFSLFYFADRLDWLLMLFGSIGSCIHGAALPVFFVLFGKLIDSLGSLSSNPQRLSDKVSKHALELVYLGAVAMISAWIGVAFWMQTGERQTARLRVKYIQSILQQDISFFDTDARDENIISHITSDAILVQDAIGDKTGHCLRYLSQFFVGFVVGFTSVWQLTLLTLAVVPLIVIAGGTYAVVMAGLAKKGESAYAEAGKVAEEVISQVRTVYSYVGEDKAIAAYSRSLENALKLGRKSGLAKGVGVGCTYGILFCAWALLLCALGQAAPNLSSLAKGQAAASTIIRMIEKVSNVSEQSNGAVLPQVQGQIEFSGRTNAIVGQSGSGKSTIISLIERFYEPTSGKILLDGHDIKSLQLKWLRNQMGLVSQEPALFSASIAKNILYGREDAGMEDIINAAKIANAHCFIQSLPNGYSTEVGEGGFQLSGGQKQRIAIVRAILRNPRILLLDEATSALDYESERLVQNALEKVKLDRTTVVIAHRLSTISNAHIIVVLNNGKVTESGTHEELMTKGEKGEYAMLVHAQLLDHRNNKSLNDHKETMNSSEKAVSTNACEVERNHEKAGLKTLGNKEINQDFGSARSTPVPSIRKIIRLNQPEWPFAVTGSLGAILAGAEGPLFAFGITHVLTAFYSHDKSHIRSEIRMVSLIFIGAAIITVPIYVLQHYFYTLMGEKLTSRVRLNMFSEILKNEIAWFDRDENSSGSLALSLAADATLVRSTVADRMSTIIQNISLTMTAFIIAFVLSWRMAAVVLATFPLLIAASIAEQLFLKGFGGNYTVAYARATSVAREAITNIRTVAAFCAEDQVSSQFTQELDRPNKKAFTRGHIAGIGYGLSQSFAFCSYALGLWYAAQLIKNGTSNFGNIMKSFMVLIITSLGIAETLALTPDIVKGSQALGSVFSILERKTRIDANDPSSEVVEEIKGDIEFRNVSFRYPTRPDITVLKELSLHVAAGRSLALVGQSGSGKSSVISLLMRFYDPSSGEILIDNKNIKSVNLRSLRMRIGLVQQEPALFSTTIYENIAYGKPGASEIEVLKAAKAANVDGFISRMPEGYTTQVGERGAQLSGGQKQRVAIARAILKDPSILLLDEATSALDTASEKVVQEALNRLMEGRTTILIAHRLSTIRDANVIAVLQEGIIHEIGSHEELLRQPNGIYTQLVQLQNETH
ncbi:ABC transporter B family member 13 [Dendrobium catenatum]|uniref:ABC transporter B family member 13 n=1 Tax=Dendrobium catenatum TaxID=906689 RepID=A0A2I0X7W6_9ASPA|nr:ABC transporter B family member 13 [Dendrobium catenatum]